MTSARDMVITAAETLGPLRTRVAFLGGAATPLLVTDPAAPPARPTLDVDVIVEVGSLYEYHFELRNALQERGFREDTDGDVICRWICGSLTLDIMPTREDILGFSCRWYPDAIRHACAYALRADLEIQLITAPYFLAAKLEAFGGRGNEDYWASHDMEDIVSVVDGRPELLDEVAAADPSLRQYLAETFSHHIDHGLLDAVPGHLPPDPASQERASIAAERLKSLATGTRP